MADTATGTVEGTDVARLQVVRDAHERLLKELSKVIVGQRDVLEQVLMAILAGGHCLLEGVPGLAKTLLVSSIADALHLEFKRIQFTNDLLPADITGVSIYDQEKKKFQFPINEWGVDLQSEHERFLVEKHFKCPVILFDYPANIKAFYMRLNDDGKTVRAMDVLFPGIGEIVGGSQREERLEVLEKRIKEMEIDKEELWWYLDLRRFGSVPHSGFGLGLERLILFATGMSNIRDVIPFPRTPKNAEF